MEKADELYGIYLDNQFMDHLYQYGQLSNDVKNQSATLPNNERERNIEKCVVCRIHSVNFCLSKIDSTEQGSKDWYSYFNYIRLNQDNIANELESYLQQPCMEKLHGTISACSQYMNYVMGKLCKFTVADEAIISEYKHAYGIISHSQRKPSTKVLHQTGKLFVNFVDILARRYFYIETADIKFGDLEKEAGVIFDKLYADFPKEAETVKMAHTNFIQLIIMQDEYRALQKSLLQQALKLAHARATRKALEIAKDHFLKAISVVKEKLRVALQNTIKVGEAIVYPIMHPTETAKSIWYTIQHPTESIHALLSWAIENPWKSVGIIAIGGLVGGLVGGIAFGAGGVMSAVGTVAGAVAPLAVTAQRAQTLVKSADDEASKRTSEYDTLVKKMETEGVNIVEQALDGDLWVILNKRNEGATPDQELETMSYDKLLRNEKELSEKIPVIENQIQAIQKDAEETKRDMSSDLEDASVMQQASNILKKRIANLTISEQNWSI